MATGSSAASKERSLSCCTRAVCAVLCRAVPCWWNVKKGLPSSGDGSGQGRAEGSCKQRMKGVGCVAIGKNRGGLQVAGIRAG